MSLYTDVGSFSVLLLAATAFFGSQREVSEEEADGDESPSTRTVLFFLGSLVAFGCTGECLARALYPSWFVFLGALGAGTTVFGPYAICRLLLKKRRVGIRQRVSKEQSADA